MKNENFKNYVIQVTALLKKQAKEAKRDKDDSNPKDKDYNIGQLMSYYSVISTLKNQALAFNIDEKDLSLDDINPDQDLL